MSVFDKATFITRFKVRANGPSSLVMTLPNDRGLIPGEEIELFGLPGAPLDNMMIRKVRVSNSENNGQQDDSNKPESTDGGNGDDNRKDGEGDQR